MERENSVKDLDKKYGMRWNLKNWLFDIIEILFLHLRKIRNKNLCAYPKLISTTI